MKNLLFTATLLCSLALASCNKDDSYTPQQPVPSTANEYINSHRNDGLQEKTINTADLPKTFIFDEGTKITIPAGTFTIDGVPVTGQVTLEVREMLRPSSIVFSGTSTNYWGSQGGRYLDSDGFVYVNAKSNGKYVDEYLAHNITITIPTDKANGTETKIWPGEEQNGANEDQFAWRDLNDNDFNWKDGDVAGGNGGANNPWRGVQANGGNFVFDFGKLGWANCDVLWGEGKQRVTVNVTLSGHVGELASYLGYTGDTFVLFCGKGYLLIAHLYTVVDGHTVKSYDNSMPAGDQGKMFAFRVKDGKYYFSSKDVTIASGLNVDLNLQEVTKEYVDNFIQSLDNYAK